MLEQTPGAEETLADAFRAVSRQLRHRTQQALAPWDVTPSQARALGVLARHGAVRLGTLSEHLRIAPRSATEVVDALAAAGLVERRPDPADRRVRLVTVTDAGRATLRRARSVVRSTEDELLADLGDDQEVLRRLLQTALDGRLGARPGGGSCV